MVSIQSTLAPAPPSTSTSATTPRPTGANAAHCRSGGHPPVDLIPAGAGQSAPLPASAAAPRPTVAPYHCDTCGSDNPYRSGRMRHRGGLGCKACRAVTKAIQDAHLGTLHRLSRPAYKLGVHGDQKRAIIRYAEAEARQVWAEASASFGIAVPSAELEVIEVIIAEVRAMAAAGMIGPEALTDAGNALLDAGQDMALAADRQVAA